MSTLTEVLRSWGGQYRRGLDRLVSFGVATLVLSFVLQPSAEATCGDQKIAVGDSHSCRVTPLGGLECWGENDDGQLGDGTNVTRYSPVPVVGLTEGVAAVATGEDHTCVLTTTGGMKCWGLNDDGQLGDGTNTPSNTPVDVSGLTSDVAAISAGDDFTCAVTNTGAVKCWGVNSEGQLGDGGMAPSSIPVDVVGLSGDAQAVALGEAHACALISGSVQCWGDNGDGQLGDGTNTDSTMPVDVVGLTGVRCIPAKMGQDHSCALTNTGGAKCWGENNNGELGDGSNVNRSTPVDVVGLASGVASLSAGFEHTCATVAPGRLLCWGENTEGRLGDGTTMDRNVPTQVVGLTSGVVESGLGDGHTCALTALGAVLCWGDNGDGQLGLGGTQESLVALDVIDLDGGVSSVDSAEDHSCVVTAPGGIKCWGSNQRGQLGDGTDLDRGSPVDVIGLTSGMSAVSTGGDHTCALTDTGGAKCWGSNPFGQLGDGTTDDRLTPVDVVGFASGVDTISAGGNFTCALTSLGGVKCWGLGSRLGDGTSMSSSTPVDVVGLTSGVDAISTGSSHTCALTTTGGVKCWGNNAQGRLGDGTTTARLTPVDVVGLTSGVAAIAVGGTHTCARLIAGGVKCWGRNLDGQLGTGGTGTTNSTPLDVVGSSDFVELFIGGRHTCALNSSGELKCWGSNSFGQLGDGSTEDALVPIDTPAIPDGVTSMGLGDDHSCFLLGSSRVVCVGSNDDGQLGDGTVLETLVPLEAIPPQPQETGPAPAPLLSRAALGVLLLTLLAVAAMAIRTRSTRG